MRSIVSSELLNAKIAIVGLGYVGLPLAVEFSKKYKVFGFDIHQKRIDELKSGFDRTNEISNKNLNSVLTYDCNSNTGLFCTTDTSHLDNCNFFIITVPTPVDRKNQPDLKPLLKASETVGRILKKGDTVIYESTVYPGVTEDECVPVLEDFSGLKYNVDFFVGYSPERINPGDKEHTIEKILKVTSGSTPAAATQIDNLYNSIIIAGTFKAASIKVAEAAKVIENAQRDINIAFVNELAKIFNLLDIDTSSVLEAAATKWNFLKFKPGLVGGHCIGVDPYYLAQKAQQVGYHPEIILAGRRLNDGMGAYVADEVIKKMVHKNVQIFTSKVLILGFTFKENCPDVRNTKVIDIVRRLEQYHIDVCTCDPWANSAEVQREYGINCQSHTGIADKYDAVIIAVAHSAFEDLDLNDYCKDEAVIYDLKSIFPRELISARL